MNQNNHNINELSYQILSKLDSLENRLIAISSQPKPIIDMEEAADLLRMSKYTLYTKTSRGEIPFYKEGRKIYFKRDELLEHITRKENRRKSNTEIEVEAATLSITKGRG